jgi:hypothetical protein
MPPEKLSSYVAPVLALCAGLVALYMMAKHQSVPNEIWLFITGSTLATDSPLTAILKGKEDA